MNYNLKTKSLTRMRSSSSLLGRDLLGIAYGSKSKIKSLEESLTNILMICVIRGCFIIGSSEFRRIFFLTFCCHVYNVRILLVKADISEYLSNERLYCITFCSNSSAVKPLNAAPTRHVRSYIQ